MIQRCKLDSAFVKHQSSRPPQESILTSEHSEPSLVQNPFKRFSTQAPHAHGAGGTAAVLSDLEGPVIIAQRRTYQSIHMLITLLKLTNLGMPKYTSHSWSPPHFNLSVQKGLPGASEFSGLLVNLTVGSIPMTNASRHVTKSFTPHTHLCTPHTRLCTTCSANGSA